MIVRLDLADLLGEQHLVVALAVENLLARLAHAHRAERVGLARPAERRLHLLPRLQQRLLRPLRRERLVRPDAVERVENGPRALGDEGQTLFDVLHRLVHNPPRTGRQQTQASGQDRVSRQKDTFQPGPDLQNLSLAGSFSHPNWPPTGVNGQPVFAVKSRYFKQVTAAADARAPTLVDAEVQPQTEQQQQPERPTSKAP